jgi:hypothetical protein
MEDMFPKYSSTRNKERVRVDDTRLIEKEFKRKKKKLSYLGMPSGEIRDVLAWKEYIARGTAIELDEKQYRELILNIIRNTLDGIIDVLLGDIEDILILGKDSYNNKLEYPYDIVFLDCFGSIIYPGFKRIKAIRSLIENQRGHPFLFLLTLNLRERRYCKQSIIYVLKKIQDELDGLYYHDGEKKHHIHTVLSWYQSEGTPEMYRQKIFIPYLFKNIAEENGFKIHVYSPVFYLGYNKSPMIHFAIKFSPEFDSPVKAFSDQNIVELFNIKIKECSKARIGLREEQAPSLEV